PQLDPTYIRVLAQNKRGGEIISHMKKHSSIPVVQKSVELKEDEIFAVEARATDIYNIPLHLPSGEEFRYSPIQIKD
ncbi:MAG: nucleotidyltransferase family protein, partial [Clostridia bacterium]|nr:nucleotidyltransferase family protein [Clostridia bacterium]